MRRWETWFGALLLALIVVTPAVVIVRQVGEQRRARELQRRSKEPSGIDGISSCHGGRSVDASLLRIRINMSRVFFEGDDERDAAPAPLHRLVVCAFRSR